MQLRVEMQILSYPVFVAFKHASYVSILIIGAVRREVLHAGDHLIVLFKLPRLN